MKNYRTIELPDCCGMCRHFCCEYGDEAYYCAVSYDKQEQEYLRADIHGLCDDFKRCGAQNEIQTPQDCSPQNPKSEPQRPDIDKCKCNLRTRLVGDGCQYCNPEYHAEMLQEDDGEG